MVTRHQDPPPRRQGERQDRQEASESGSVTEAEEAEAVEETEVVEEAEEVKEDEGGDEEGDRDGETPRGAPVEVFRVGGGGRAPPHRKTRTSQTLPLNVRT